MNPPPQLAHTRAELAALLTAARASGAPVGFVPTMGALHEGHASLARVARQQVGEGAVVVSIFVNPMQFGPTEDLARYPRTLDADLQLCEAEGVDVVFAPTVEEVYPGGEPQVSVDPGPVATVLEGRTRPGHFHGVLTVVAKLFGLVRPDLAVFGEKDYQQLTLIRRMASDLCLPIQILGAPTLREPDGLAMSSRNRYLDPTQRHQAVVLNRALRAAQEAAVAGPEAAERAAYSVLDGAEGVELDYLVVTGTDLGPLADPVAPGMPGRVLIAARVGSTRLIDNLPLVFGDPAGQVARGR